MSQESKDGRLTLVQAATRLGLSLDQTRRRITQGHLEGGQELGRWWWVSAESVERYLEQQQAAAS